MKNLRIIIIVLLLNSLPFIVFSQPVPRYNGNGTSVGNNPVGGNPSGAPVDGGLGILLALGLGYGFKTFTDHRKRK